MSLDVHRVDVSLGIYFIDIGYEQTAKRLCDEGKHDHH